MRGPIGNNFGRPKVRRIGRGALLGAIGPIGLRPTLRVPVCVAGSVLEVQEVLVIHVEEVTRVEVQVAFPENVPQDTLLGLLGSLVVPFKRSLVRDRAYQQADLACSREGTRVIHFNMSWKTIIQKTIVTCFLSNK